MMERICEVAVNPATGDVSAVILEGSEEVARISWTLGPLVWKDRELAMDMITSRFRAWARVYHTRDVQIRFQEE